MNFVTNLLTNIDQQVDHYIFDGYHALVNNFSTTLTILLVIYFAGLGWLVIRGVMPLSPSAVAWHMFKAALIFAFALHWDYFSYFIMDFFLHGTDRIIGALLNASQSNANPHTITEAMGEIWQNGNNVFADVWRMSGSEFLLGTLLGFLGYAVVIGIVGTALFYIVMSKIALSVLLVLAPITLPMFLWDSAKEIFNGWLRLLLQWMITPVFIYAFIGLYLQLLKTTLSTMAASQGGPSTASIAGFTLLGVIVMASFKQAGNMSRDLAKKVSLGRVNPLSLWERARERAILK
jgi:type IV secretory pathway VirB6-like protein